MQASESQLETLAIEQEALHVTRSFLPPLEEYRSMVEQIWASGQLTNNGPFLLDFESGLRDYFRNPNCAVVNNGTIAIQIMLKALDIQGEVLTTPFSYVATTSSLVWEGCKPVFVDIDGSSLNMDPARIEEAITDRTTAILATHVFGNPCDVEAIEEIAQRRGLKVMYDAAHAFGVSYKGSPLVNYGDASTLSFHATKLFHCIEGGAILSNDEETFEKFNFMRNFGHDGQEAFQGIGINGKMSEFHAAMGVLNLQYLSRIKTTRESAWKRYYEAFSNDERVEMQSVLPDTDQNHAYFSIAFKNETSMLTVRQQLNAMNIYPRRYFYPSLDTLPYVEGNCAIARDVSQRILCLPLFSEMDSAIQESVIAGVFKGLGD